MLTEIKLEDTQSPIVNSFPIENLLLVGKSKGPEYIDDKGRTKVDLQFEHVFSYIKFEIVSDDIAGIRFLGRNNEVLANASNGISINCSGELPYLTGISTASDKKQIYVNGDKDNPDVKLSPGVYYLTTFPRNLTNGLRFGLYTDNFSKVAKEVYSTSPVDLKPGMILDLGKFNSSGRVKE